MATDVEVDISDSRYAGIGRGERLPVLYDPDEPTSSQVVTPVRAATGSASMPQ